MSEMNPVEQLQALAATAVIGTERGSGSVDASGKLLTNAAFLGSKARAGYRPRCNATAIPAPPIDPRPVAPERAMGTLLRLLADPDAETIDEWGRLAQSRGFRIADASVPTTLEWWSRQPQRSEAVFAACGKMGEWLAELNTSWRKPVASAAIPANAEEIWQTGKSGERAALLTTIRRLDAARGLALVQSTWATDGADERSKFLTAMLEGRSMADEPFIEAALDDKSKNVRAQATQFLGLLRGSRLRARMNERARSIIKVEKKGLLKRGVKIVLEPPKEFDKSWERDGIAEDAASGKGKRAWWMRQILEHTDLAVWNEISGLDAGGVIAALEGDDFAEDALAAMVVAATAAGDPGWCAALVDAMVERPKVSWQQYSGLWQSLAAADREALALRAADRIKTLPEDRWLLVAAVEGPWSAEFSADAMKLLRKHAPGKKRDAWQYWHAMEEVSRRIDPAAADFFEEAIAAIGGDDPTPSIRKSIDRVRLRAEMYKEFAA